jgi:hypothetical protein
MHSICFDPRLGDDAPRAQLYDGEGRTRAAQQIKRETRAQPRAEAEIEPVPQVARLREVGCLVLCSAARMHFTVDSTTGPTRFGIAFRTVHVDDVTARRSARTTDSHSTGTTLRDDLRGTDSSRLPEEIVAPCDTPLVGAEATIPA